MRLLKRKMPKMRLIVYTGNGDMVNTEKQQLMKSQISLEKYLRKIFKVPAKNILLAASKSPSQKKRSVWHPRN